MNYDKLFIFFMGGVIIMGVLVDAIGGTGIVNYIPKFSGLEELNTSNITDSGSAVNVQTQLYEAGSRVCTLANGLCSNTFINSTSSGGTSNYTARWYNSTHLTNGNIFDNETHIGIGTITPTAAYIEIENNNANVGYGLLIDQNTDSRGLTIQSNATTNTNVALEVQTTSAGARTARFYQAGNQIDLYIEKAGTGTGNAISVLNEGTGNGVFIDQNGNGVSLNIDSEATSANLISLDGVTTGRTIYAKNTGAIAEYMVDINEDSGVASGHRIVFGGGNTKFYRTALFYRNLNSTLTGDSEVIISQASTIDDQDTLEITQVGTGDGIEITQSNTGTGIIVDGTGTGYSAIFNNGNVGIKTTAPNETLHVSGNVNITQNLSSKRRRNARNTNRRTKP